MAPPTPKPTILLVQGSFQLPTAYEKFSKALESRGFEVVHPPLPSLTGQDLPDFAKKDLATDAAAIQEAAARLVDQGKIVMLVMHSYGGLVGSEAIPEELSRLYRKAKGLPGGVAHLFYVAAFIFEKGRSVFDMAGGESPNNRCNHETGRFTMSVWPKKKEEDGPLVHADNLLYHDLPEKEAKEWEEKLIDQSHAVQTTKLTRAAYEYIASTYVVTGDDKAVPAEFQENVFAKTAGAKIKRIQTSHSPQLSKPEELADLVEEVAASIAE
jgi:pimeloyl-ACP methyl ester carboxylesterase